jgi:hypothetical protein
MPYFFQWFYRLLTVVAPLNESGRKTMSKPTVAFELDFLGIEQVNNEVGYGSKAFILALHSRRLA